MIWVTDATYVKNYCLSLQFNDGTGGVVDLEDVIKNDHRAVFQELADIEAFRRFKVDMDTVVWDNGLDLAPEFLYDRVRQNSLA